VYRTDDIAENGRGVARLRTTSIALGVWAVLAGGIGFSAYYAVSSALSGADPAGGVFSGIERVVVVIITVIAAALVALLAGRLLLTVTSGAVARRRGFAHERVAEVEGTLRRPLWVAIIAAVVVGRRRAARRRALDAIHFLRWPPAGDQPRRDRGAARPADARRWLRRRVPLVRPGSQGAAIVADAFLPLRVAAEGFYVERLTELAAQPLLAIAGRVSSLMTR